MCSDNRQPLVSGLILLYNNNCKNLRADVSGLSAERGCFCVWIEFRRRIGIRKAKQNSDTEILQLWNPLE